MRSFGSAISNGTIILENTVKDRVNLKNATDNFEKFTRPRLPEKMYEKGVTLKNDTDLIVGMQRVINASESRISPTHSRALPNTSDDNFDRAITSEAQSIFSLIKLTQGKRT